MGYIRTGAAHGAGPIASIQYGCMPTARDGEFRLVFWDCAAQICRIVPMKYVRACVCVSTRAAAASAFPSRLRSKDPGPPLPGRHRPCPQPSGPPGCPVRAPG